MTNQKPVVEIILPHKLRKKTFKRPRPLATISLAILAVALVGAVTYSVLAYKQQTKQDTSLKADKVDLPKGEEPLPSSNTPELKNFSLLNGLPVEAGTESLHPLAVMIENHPDARPQSGLSQADLVYEAMAEGGITRFMAVFGNPSLPVKVGPVRSARPYFVDFATEINAFYAHVGGNIDALDQIKNTGVYDLDQFSVGSPVYKRETNRSVPLEHTMYSSTEKLWDYAVNKKKWPKTADYSPWKFQNDLSQDQRSGSQTINVNVSDSLYAVIWEYDAASNSYKRKMAGSNHTDLNTGKQITTKNIVLQTVERQPHVTRINESGWKYTLTGNGSALIFQNGKTIQGTWRKEGKERTRYYDQTGKEIDFVRGTIWIQIIHADSRVSYN